MRRFLIAILFYLFILPLFGNNVLAYECLNLNIDPLIGDPYTTFHLEATDCSLSEGDIEGQGYFDVLVTGPSEFENIFSAQLIANTIVLSEIGGFTQNGIYTVVLRYREGAVYIQEIGTLTIEIIDGSDEPPGPDTTLYCGSPCAIASTCDFCPSFCPAHRNVLDGTPFWTCGETTLLCQNMRFDSIGISAAIGCIPFEILSSTASFFLKWGVVVGGGVAFILITISGLLIMTSTGDPRKLQGAKELFWAALTGLLLIIFSVFLLRLIGVNILGIL